MWTTFADTLAAFGTMSNLGPGENFTTVELKTNVFAAAKAGDVLTAVGEPLHRGKRTQVWEVRMYNGDRLAANFVCTQMVLERGVNFARDVVDAADPARRALVELARDGSRREWTFGEVAARSARWPARCRPAAFRAATS